MRGTQLAHGIRPVVAGRFASRRVVIEATDLAAAYSRAYETRPEDLVAKAMLGQPIIPETPLSERTFGSC